MTQREWRTGSIERRRGRGGDRYRARVRMPDGKRAVLGVFDTEHEAAGVIAAAAEQLAAAGMDPNVGISLAAYGKQWLEQREREGKRNAAKERSCWSTHVAKERFALGPIGAITKRDVRDWVRSLMLRRVTQTVRTNEGSKPSRASARSRAKRSSMHSASCDCASMKP